MQKDIEFITSMYLRGSFFEFIKISSQEIPGSLYTKSKHGNFNPHDLKTFSMDNVFFLL